MVAQSFVRVMLEAVPGSVAEQMHGGFAASRCGADGEELALLMRAGQLSRH